jgi:hypothetical protein
MRTATIFNRVAEAASTSRQPALHRIRLYSTSVLSGISPPNLVHYARWFRCVASRFGGPMAAPQVKRRQLSRVVGLPTTAPPTGSAEPPDAGRHDRGVAPAAAIISSAHRLFGSEQRICRHFR